MNYARRLPRALALAVALAASGISLAQATRPTTTQPATRPATTPAASRPTRERPDDAIRPALLKLQGEAQDALRRNQPFPRKAPDYFTTGDAAATAATVKQTDLIRALARRINQNPRVDAYVKWQLLSLAPQFDEAHAMDAMKAYVLGAPPLIPLPGLDQRERQEWDRKGMTAKETDVAGVNEEWTKKKAPYEAANEIVVLYRDEMAKRIAVPPELKAKLLQARLEDLSQRAAAGLDTNAAFKSLSIEIKTWAPLAKRAAVREMIAFATEYTRRTGPVVYEKLMWSDRTKKTYWRDRKAELDRKLLDGLIESLTEAEKHALP